MPRIIPNSSRAATTASQAPWVNLVSITITSTRPVTQAPKPLITRERWASARTFGSGSLPSSSFQCRTMPIWESVKEVKTPRMYRWIRLLTLAL